MAAETELVSEVHQQCSTFLTLSLPKSVSTHALRAGRTALGANSQRFIERSGGVGTYYCDGSDQKIENWRRSNQET